MTKLIQELKEYLEQEDSNIKGVCFILSKDKNVISYLLDILDNERKEAQELINDLSINTSKSNMLIIDTKNTAKNSIPRDALIKETVEMFKKWKHKISHFAKDTVWSRNNNLDL